MVKDKRKANDIGTIWLFVLSVTDDIYIPLHPQPQIVLVEIFLPNREKICSILVICDRRDEQADTTIVEKIVSIYKPNHVPFLQFEQ